MFGNLINLVIIPEILPPQNAGTTSPYLPPAAGGEQHLLLLRRFTAALCHSGCRRASLGIGSRSRRWRVGPRVRIGGRVGRRVGRCVGGRVGGRVGAVGLRTRIAILGLVEFWEFLNCWTSSRNF